MPAVSIIATFHNEADYLEQNLSSLLNQTLEDIEIICVEDSSTDGTPALLDRFSAQDSRIKLFKSKARNCSRSRNLGLKQARGEYIAFVDGDDHVDPEFYECLYIAAKSSWPGGADGARAGYTSFQDDREHDDRFCKLIDQRVNEGCLLNSWDNSNVVWNAIYRRETLIVRDCYYFLDDPKTAEDLFWTLRAMHRLRTMVPVSKIRYRHRIGKPGQLSTVTLQNTLNVLKANSQGLDYVNSARWQNVDEYFHQFERILWRYWLLERRLRGYVDEGDKLLTETRTTMQFAYESCRYPSMIERIGRHSWWSDLTKIITVEKGTKSQID
ncbi:MAG: hypothetical protein MnENMB40S_14160 [Rhizobiaceae bacterium MnEN-MB40S]|nr:MAG: hypothetical protein MnENMB40S_14160 [Rhizobiaceae bacterium MnEN-MB40S]